MKWWCNMWTNGISQQRMLTWGERILHCAISFVELHEHFIEFHIVFLICDWKMAHDFWLTIWTRLPNHPSLFSSCFLLGSCTYSSQSFLLVVFYGKWWRHVYRFSLRNSECLMLMIMMGYTYFAELRLFIDSIDFRVYCCSTHLHHHSLVILTLNLRYLLIDFWYLRN